MKHVKGGVAMLLSIVMMFSLMTGVGAPNAVAAAYDTEIIDVVFETECSGTTLQTDASWMAIKNGDTSNVYFVKDVCTWTPGAKPTEGGTYTYEIPKWSVSPAGIVQITKTNTGYAKEPADSGVFLSPVGTGTATLTWSTSKMTKTITIHVVDTLATAVTVEPTSVTLQSVGQQLQLTPTVTPAGASQNVVWTTDNASVATVSDSGVVTAVGSGTCFLYAHAIGGNAVKKSVKVTVQLAGDASKVYGYGDGATNEITLAPGGTAYVPFNAFYANMAGTKYCTSSDFTCESDKPAVATVDSNGLITAVNEGTATILLTAINPNSLLKTAEIPVTVSSGSVTVVPVTGVNISQTSAKLNVGQYLNLSASVIPSNATNQTISWSCSNTDVVTLTGTQVYAKAPGTAVITVTSVADATKYAQCTVTVTASVEDIELSKTNLTLNKNATETITAAVLPSWASNKTITVQSKDSNIATVKDNGNGSYTIQGVAKGTTDIVFTAADNGKTKSCSVTVNPTKVSSITINGGNEVTIGSTLQLSAAVSPADADNKSVNWESLNTDVVTVSSTGLVTAKSVGTAKIHVASADGGATADITITVKPKYVTGISVTAAGSKTTLKKGETVQLTAGITPSDATYKNVAWTSSNDDLVTVNASGMAEIVADNTYNTTVTITAKAQDGSDKSGTIQLTVIPTPVESFTISGGSVGVGNTLQLQATAFTPATATNKTITSWESSNTNVATISSTGVVTGKTAGTTTITATCADGKTATATITVVSNVVNVTSFTLDKTSATLTVGDTCQIEATVLPENATNKTLTWTVTEGTDVVTISDITDTARPVLAAKKVGTAKIEVKSASNPNLAVQYITITVQPKYVTGITITADKTGSVSQGGMVQLTAAVTPSDATKTGVTWSSSNPSLATVNSETGLVEIKKTGSSTPASVVITATAKDGSASHTAFSQTYTIQIAGETSVTVMVSDVVINGDTTQNVMVGDKAFTVTAGVKPQNATNQTLKWEVTEGAGVVSIAANGSTCTVTPKSVGTAKIKVSSAANPEASAILVVNVTANTSHTHTYTEQVIQQATCTQPGITRRLCACGDYTDVTIPALGHSYADTVVAPTTTSEGYTVHTCTRCGNSYNDTYVPKLESPAPDPGTPVEKAVQTITAKTSYTKIYGNKAFSLDAKTNGDGQLTYATSNKKVVTVSGTGKVTIKGTGKAVITITAAETDAYKAAELKVTITVKPKKATLSKLTSKKKSQVTVKWKKDSKASGYEITLATDKKFKKNKKTVLVKSYKKTSATVKKLKSKKTYYVRIRSYKTVNGKKVYGAYSKVLKIKVK